MKVLDKVPDFKIEHVFAWSNDGHDRDHDENGHDDEDKGDKSNKYTKAQEKAELFRSTMMTGRC